MNKRLKELRKALGLTQQEFADRLKIGRGTLANYEVGRNEPLDAVINLICREFNVSEVWLRTGEGDMFVDTDIQDEIAGFMADVFNDDTDFRRRLISILAKLSPAEWALIENMARKLAETEKNTGPEGPASEDITGP